MVTELLLREIIRLYVSIKNVNVNLLTICSYKHDFCCHFGYNITSNRFVLSCTLAHIETPYSSFRVNIFLITESFFPPSLMFLQLICYTACAVYDHKSAITVIKIHECLGISILYSVIRHRDPPPRTPDATSLLQRHTLTVKVDHAARITANKIIFYKHLISCL